MAVRATSSPLVAGALAALLVLSLAPPLPVRASTVVFDTPTASATLGVSVVFETRLTATEPPARVEVLVSTPDDERSVTVLAAQLTGGAGGDWLASAILLGHSPPNTVLDYRFRAHEADGTLTLGPPASVTVVDEGYAWQVLEGTGVRLHWHEGDMGFAERALQIGEDAVTRASELLGVTEFETVDFFLYGTQEGLRGALGPGAREWSAGQARPNIRTMFGLIQPFDINSSWVEVLLRHELTHLVFHAATDNPYHGPPGWLDEGLAVYLAEGYGTADRATVERAARAGELMPLAALGGAFPTQRDRALLAYAESVSAIEFFVTTYGEDRLGALVSRYAEGVSDDEAFLAATGADMAAFDSAWMGWLGVEPPEPFGPLPGPPGPVPSDWNVEPAPSPGPDGPSPTLPEPMPTVPGSPAVPGKPVPPVSPAPTTAPGSGQDGGPDAVMVLAVGAGVALGVLLIGLLVFAQRKRRMPPPPPPPTAPWS